MSLAAVGFAVGFVVGFAVGLVVGLAVGFVVGTAVGIVVGIAVGSVVGVVVGVDAVGFGFGWELCIGLRTWWALCGCDELHELG